MAIAVSYVGSHDIGGDAGGAVSSTINIGTAAADRLVVVIMHYRSNADMATPTLDGNAMTLVVKQADTGSAPDVRCGMFQLLVTTGTTATLATSGQAPASNAFVVSVFNLTGANTTSTDNDNQTGSAASSSMTGLTVATGGAAIVGWINVTSGTASSPTGFSERNDAASTAGSNAVRYSAGDTTTAGTNTITFDGGTSNQCAVGAAWDVAAAGGTFWSRSRSQIDNSFRGYR